MVETPSERAKLRAMCNRFTNLDPREIKRWSSDLLEWEFLDLEAAYNAAPSQRLPVVKRDRNGKPKGLLMRWGVRPAGAPRIYLNAKQEKAFSYQAWREAIQNRRCAVLADGFYEWPPEPAKKTPTFFRRKDGRPFAFAGFWFPGATENDETFAILTTTPNSATAAIGHPRSPVMLDESNVRQWMEPGPLGKEELAKFVQPYPGEQMESFRVSMRVNNSRVNDADCVRPLSKEEAELEDTQPPPNRGIESAERENGQQLKLL